MKKIAQKVNEMPHTMVRFSHPQRFRIWGTFRADCKDLQHWLRKDFPGCTANVLLALL
jgi:hypothetical protein